MVQIQTVAEEKQRVILGKILDASGGLRSSGQESWPPVEQLWKLLVRWSTNDPLLTSPLWDSRGTDLQVKSSIPFYKTTKSPPLGHSPYSGRNTDFLWLFWLKEQLCFCRCCLLLDSISPHLTMFREELWPGPSRTPQNPEGHTSQLFQLEARKKDGIHVLPSFG